jgi:hypothetical protein
MRHVPQSCEAAEKSFSKKCGTSGKNACNLPDYNVLRVPLKGGTRPGQSGTKMGQARKMAYRHGKPSS